jgi:hypothetical protein
MELAFSHPETDGEREVAAAIAKFHAPEGSRIEQELCGLRKRLADAERKLGAKVTNGASEDRRIATNKISGAMRALADLKRTTRDERVFPGVCAPVMVMEAGELVVMPMRYQCRPEGKPSFYDR